MINEQYIPVFLSGIATAYFALSAYMLFSRKSASRLQIVVGFIFVLWALLNLKDFLFTLFFEGNETKGNYIVLLDGLSLIGYTSLLYELISPRWTTWRKVLMMLVAYVPFFIGYALRQNEAIISWYIGCLGLAGIIIFIHWYWQARQYVRFIRNNYSNIDEIDISWLRIVMLLFVVCQLVWVAISFIRLPMADSLYYIVSIGLWQYTLIHIIHQVPISVESQEMEPVMQVGGGKSYAFEQTLPLLIEQEELYLNPHLSIKELATRVGTNRTYLSDYFVNGLQTTFYDYINELRIEKKCLLLMREHPDYTIDRIASESGFQSISTFRRSFQKLKGMSPGTYKKKLITK